MESPAVLFAQIGAENSQKYYSIQLKKNNAFEIEVGMREYGCTYPGKYTLKGDTVLLSKNYVAETDSMFTDKYVMDKTNQYLYPVKKDNKLGDNSRWLRILLMKM